MDMIKSVGCGYGQRDVYMVCPRCGNEMRVHNTGYWWECHRDDCQLSGANGYLECLAKETECDSCGYIEEDNPYTCTCNELEAKELEAKELEASNR